MAIKSNVVDLITQASQPVLKSGDLLAPPTVAAGFIGDRVVSDDSIANGQELFIIQGEGSVTTAGAKDVETLTLGAATTAGNITIHLNGIDFVVAVAAGDTATVVGNKVVAEDFSIAGYTAANNAGVVTFTATANGVKPEGTFTDTGTTGVTGTFAVTTAGKNDVYGQYNVYPVALASDRKSYVADTTKEPIIIQTSGKVVYAGGRNSKQGDVYNNDGIQTVTVSAGNEPKEVLKAFLLYASEQFSFGVIDFENGKAQYIQV